VRGERERGGGALCHYRRPFLVPPATGSMQLAAAGAAGARRAAAFGRADAARCAPALARRLFPPVAARSVRGGG